MVRRTLSSIQVESEGDWAGEAYLSIDIDWAHDFVLEDTIALVEKYSVPATWFVTHNTPMLNRLRANSNFELGIHPNFNFLLNGNSRSGKDASDVVKRLLDFVPEAKCVRSHSTTRSSGLLDLFVQKKLTHESNLIIPIHSGIKLRPWQLWSGITCVPYFWEDDVHLLYESMGIPQKNPAELAVSWSGLKVFDFHPIHVFLNSESLDRYHRTRHVHKNPKELINQRNKSYGTRSRLIELLELSKNF